MQRNNPTVISETSATTKERVRTLFTYACRHHQTSKETQEGKKFLAELEKLLPDIFDLQTLNKLLLASSYYAIHLSDLIGEEMDAPLFEKIKNLLNLNCKPDEFKQLLDVLNRLSIQWQELVERKVDIVLLDYFLNNQNHDFSSLETLYGLGLNKKILEKNHSVLQFFDLLEQCASGYNAIEIARSIAILEKMGFTWQAIDNENLKKRLTNTIIEKIKNADGSSLSAMLIALVKMGYQFDTQAIEDEVLRALWYVKGQYNAKSFTGMFQAFASLGLSWKTINEMKSKGWMLEEIFKHLNNTDKTGVIDTIWSLGEIGCDWSSLNKAEQDTLFANIVSIQKTLNPQECIDILWSLARMGVDSQAMAKPELAMLPSIIGKADFNTLNPEALSKIKKIQLYYKISLPKEFDQALKMAVSASPIIASNRSALIDKMKLLTDEPFLEEKMIAEVIPGAICFESKKIVVIDESVTATKGERKQFNDQLLKNAGYDVLRLNANQDEQSIAKRLKGRGMKIKIDLIEEPVQPPSTVWKKPEIDVTAINAVEITIEALSRDRQTKKRLLDGLTTFIHNNELDWQSDKVITKFIGKLAKVGNSGLVQWADIKVVAGLENLLIGKIEHCINQNNVMDFVKIIRALTEKEEKWNKAILLILEPFKDGSLLTFKEAREVLAAVFTKIETMNQVDFISLMKKFATLELISEVFSDEQIDVLLGLISRHADGLSDFIFVKTIIFLGLLELGRERIVAIWPLEKLRDNISQHIDTLYPDQAVRLINSLAKIGFRFQSMMTEINALLGVIRDKGIDGGSGALINYIKLVWAFANSFVELQILEESGLLKPLLTILGKNGAADQLDDKYLSKIKHAQIYYGFKLSDEVELKIKERARTKVNKSSKMHLLVAEKISKLTNEEFVNEMVIDQVLDVDIGFKKLKIVIEVDGPRHTEQRDEFKAVLLNKLGYKLFRIKYTDNYKDDDFMEKFLVNCGIPLKAGKKVSTKQALSLSSPVPSLSTKTWHKAEPAETLSLKEVQRQQFSKSGKDAWVSLPSVDTGLAKPVLREILMQEEQLKSKENRLSEGEPTRLEKSAKSVEISKEAKNLQAETVFGTKSEPTYTAILKRQSTLSNERLSTKSDKPTEPEYSDVYKEWLSKVEVALKAANEIQGRESVGSFAREADRAPSSVQGGSIPPKSLTAPTGQNAGQPKLFNPNAAAFVPSWKKNLKSSTADGNQVPAGAEGTAPSTVYKP